MRADTRQSLQTNEINGDGTPAMRHYQQSDTIQTETRHQSLATRQSLLLEAKMMQRARQQPPTLTMHG